MGKRGNREGTIYRRQNGRWVAAVTTGRVAGKRKYLYGRTREEVAGKLTDALKAQQDFLPIPSERVTVASFARDWFDDIRPSLRPKTIQSYEGILRIHLTPKLGRVRLSRLEPTHLERFFVDLAREGLSPGSIRNYHARIRTMLDKAVRLGIISRNVAKMVDLPRLVQREWPSVSPQEARAFIDAARGHRLEALFVLAITTGARQGELLGLTWDNVNVDEAEIRIRRTLQNLSGRFELVEPKTSRSRRNIALTRLATEALRRQRVRQAEDALKLGPAWNNDRDLVFTSQVGTPLDKTKVVRHQFRPLREVAGLPSQLRFHDLRHIAATLALSQGTPVPVVSEMLGHADAAITLRIYAHVIPGAQRQAADAMEDILAS